MNTVQTAPEILAREREINSTYIITAIVVAVIVTATFGAMIFAFLWRSQNGYLWEHLRIPSLLWITSALLIGSSATYESARHRLREGDQAGCFRRVQWTGGLALLFIAGQAAAWLQVMNSNLVLAQNKHSWFIFLFSGLHGLHVLAGIVGLGFILYRVHEPASGRTYQMTTRAAVNGMAIFWHYLTFLWIVLFALLLVWRR